MRAWVLGVDFFSKVGTKNAKTRPKKAGVLYAAFGVTSEVTVVERRVHPL
jgi:hypothetical protein